MCHSCSFRNKYSIFVLVGSSDCTLYHHRILAEIDSFKQILSSYDLRIREFEGQEEPVAVLYSKNNGQLTISLCDFVWNFEFFFFL